jgi:multiple sugar transport system substrate-binding protein
MAVPPGEDGTRVITSHPVTGLGIFASGEKKDAAFRFAEFVASKDMNAYWAAETGVLPANTDVTGESDLQHVDLAVGVLEDSNTKVVELPYYLPEFNAITKTDSEPLFQKVLLGELSAKDFLDQFAEKFTEAQAAYDERSGG